MHTTHDDDTALDAVTWLSRIERLVDGLSDETLVVERHIRKAYHLQCLAPLEFKVLMVPTQEEEQLEAMLERGEYGCAVERITGVSPQSFDSLAGTGEADGQAAPAEPLPLDITRDRWIPATLRAWASGFLRLRPVLH